MFEFQYYVVEFQTPVHATVPRFACIPSTWIRSHVDKKAAISFPDEPYKDTVEKIVLGQHYDEKWAVQMAAIKSGYDNLIDAQKKAIEMCIGQHDSPESNDTVKTSHKNRGKMSSSLDVKTPQKGAKHKLVIPDDITKSKYFKSDDIPKQNQIKPTSEKTTQKLNREQMIQQEKKEKEKQILKKLARVFDNMRESFDEITDTLNVMHDTVNVIKNNLSKTANITRLLNFDGNKQPSIQTAAENETKRSNRASKEESKEFTFPDNTDKSLKWTLRHQELSDGLIELLKKSGVYVRVSELEKLDSETDSPNQAALLLMKEIFSDKALSVCSLSGRGDRPALDTYSRKVLIMYLNEYCNKRHWKTDENSILTFLRRQLLQLRSNQ